MKSVRQPAEDGMTTAEYAVGTLGAASIAGVLVTNNPISDFVGRVFAEAARLMLQSDAEDIIRLPRFVFEAVQNVLPW